MITLLILVIICMQWLSGNTNHGDYIVVPDLAKKDLIEVSNLLQDKSLRFQVIDSANYRGDFPRNSVISQKPAAGSQVKANKKIYLQLNASGYSNISLPQLIQVTQRNATSKLQAVGLKVAKITYIDALGKDMVYGVKYRDKWINAGYKLPKMSEIELICGNGTRPNLDSTNVIIEFP